MATRTRRTLQGKCSFCGGTFTKRAMTQHLRTCPQRQAAATSGGAKQVRGQSFLHLRIEGRAAPEYWLHLEVRADSTLEDLDEFLRGIWLECCGHLSAFTIASERYLSHPWEEDPQGMSLPLSQVLQPGMKFYHEYDFGSTTELALTVVGHWEGPRRREAIRMLARNESPVIPCGRCGAAATNVCACCSDGASGWVCAACSDKHECGEDMLLPIVNSPRAGVCGYGG